MMKTIACFIDKYLQLSETFIYNEITHIKRFRPIVITKCVTNPAIFPFEPLFILERRKFGKIVEENRIKLIHAHFGWGGITALPFALKFNLPLVVTFYGIDASRMMHYFYYRRNIRKVFRIANLILVMSYDMKKDLIDAGCDEGKVKVYHIGIDTKKIKKKSRKENDVVRILMAGRFVEKKGLDYGIRAYKRVREQGSMGVWEHGSEGAGEQGSEGAWEQYKGMKNRNVRLVIVGDGKLRGGLEALVISLGIESCVRFTGFLTAEEVMGEMAKSDIFLAPHTTAKNGDKEGMPTTIKEAMATGLPVLSTYHAGIPELVEDKKSGFLIQERDVDGLAYYLDKLIKDPKLCEEMGKRGREIIEERFNLEKNISELEDLYEGLC